MNRQRHRVTKREKFSFNILTYRLDSALGYQELYNKKQDVYNPTYITGQY